MGDGPPAAVLADEGPVFVELDVHAVAVLGQRVIAAQLAVPTDGRLAVRAFLIPIAEEDNQPVIHINPSKQVKKLVKSA